MYKLRLFYSLHQTVISMVKNSLGARIFYLISLKLLESSANFTLSFSTVITTAININKMFSFISSIKAILFTIFDVHFCEYFRISFVGMCLQISFLIFFPNESLPPPPCHQPPSHILRIEISVILDVSDNF